MVSVIIPSSKDPFLQKTVDSILKNAKGKIEVIPVLDGFVPSPQLKKDPRVKPIFFAKNQGMRAAINAGLKKATGKFIMKSDSHCLFGPGFDRILAKSCREDWLMIPRRYSLDDGSWERNLKRPIWDYHYLSFPQQIKGYGLCMTNQNWERKTRERSDPKYNIDDTMMFQGSCWFAHRKYFQKRVGLLDDRKETYTTFGGEQIEIGLKYWLGGGQIKVNKNTWYAHLSKQRRHYNAGVFTGEYKRNSNTPHSRTWSTKHWLGDKEPGMVRPLSWLVEKFWPVPGWPEDRSLWK